MDIPIGQISLQMYRYKRGNGYAACSFIISKSNENAKYVYVYDVFMESGDIRESKGPLIRLCTSNKEVLATIHEFIGDYAPYYSEDIDYQIPDKFKKDMSILLGLVNEHNYNNNIVIRMVESLIFSLTDDGELQTELLLEIYRRLLYMKRNNNKLPKAIERDDEFEKDILPYL